MSIITFYSKECDYPCGLCDEEGCITCFLGEHLLENKKCRCPNQHYDTGYTC